MIYGAYIDDNKPIDEIIKAIGDIYDQYNWLITDQQIFSDKYEGLFANKDYVWLTGKEFRKIAESNDLYAIWCVASAFPQNITLEEILKYELPYADGNADFWVDDVKLQTPLSELEIVIFDRCSCFILSKHKAHRDLFLENINGSYDLIENNRKTNAITTIITDEVRNMQEYIENDNFVWLIYHAIFNNIAIDSKYDSLLINCKTRLKTHGLL